MTTNRAGAPPRNTRRGARRGVELEQLDGEHPGDVQLTSDAQRRVHGGGRHPGIQRGRRCEDLGADAVGLHGLDHRPRRCLPRRAARHQGGELAAERDGLLEQQAGPLGCRPLQPVGELTGILHHLHALAVVPPAWRLRDDRPAHGVPEGRDVRGGVRPHPPRARDAELGEPLAHRELVLGEPQRGRPGMQLDALGHEEVQDVRGHVLVVEGHDVAVLGEGVHGIRLGVVADGRAGDDERGAGVVRLGEDAQRHPELGRGGRHTSGPAGHPR